MLNRHYTDSKSLLKRGQKLPGTHFVIKYIFSPYRACSHACKYCDGRAEKYYVEGDFEKDIVIRQNCIELLERDLARLRERGIVGISSGVSDAYQHVEREEQLMPECARLLAEYGMPVTIKTKSNLILRDIDLWEEVHRRAGFSLFVSLTFTNDEHRKIIEPGAASVEERLALIKAFKERGMTVGALMMPLIPFISDTFENVNTLMERLEELNVDFIMPGYVTLRPGVQKDEFMRIVKRHFPQLEGQFNELYKENKISGNPLFSYRQDFERRINALYRKRGTIYMPPHSIYRSRLPLYDELFVLLTHMQELYSHRGINIKRLEEGARHYTEWLLGEKTTFNRRRSLRQADLEEQLKELAAGGGLEELIKNDKLSTLLKDVILERKLFDYRELKLR